MLNIPKNKYTGQVTWEPFNTLPLPGGALPTQGYAYPEIEKFYPGILKAGFIKTRRKSYYILWPATASDYFQITAEFLVEVPDLLKIFPWPIQRIKFDEALQIWICKRIK